MANHVSEAVKRLELTREEIVLLDEILGQQMTTLRDEIYRAETSSFKDQLKRRKDILASIIEKSRP